MLAHEEKRLIVGACVFQPIERLIGDKIGDVAIVLARAVFGDELGLVVIPLAWKDAPVVKALRLAHEVPFADDGGLVARGLQEFGQGHLMAIKGIEVIAEVAVLVRMLPGDDAGA